MQLDLRLNSCGGDLADCPLRGSLLSHTFPVCPDMVTFNYHESPTRKASLPLYRMHIIRICELFCVTDEDCALKQPVPPVSSREPTAMRYNHDDITREVGQTHGHLKTERQSVFLLQWLDVVMLKTHSERKKQEKSPHRHKRKHCSNAAPASAPMHPRAGFLASSQ